MSDRVIPTRFREATDRQGRYRLEGQLAPGLLLDGDTVRLPCAILTGPLPMILRDTVDVRFWRTQSAVVPLVIDLEYPT